MLRLINSSTATLSSRFSCSDVVIRNASLLAMNVPSTCSSYDHMGKNEVNQSTDRFDMTSSDVDSFVCSLASIGFDSFKGEDARHRALSAARKLTRRLETPIETAWAMSFDVPALYAALRAAHDNKIFIRLDEDGRKPKSTAGLADTADPALIRRILNHLAAMGIIEQLGADLWRGTSHSSSYRYPKISAVAEYSNQVTFDSYRNLPEYWRSVEYWPPDSIKGNWQHFIAKDQLFYDWVSDHPKVQDCFNNTMKGYTSQRGGWVDVYPTETIMLTAKQESPLVVDIGSLIKTIIKTDQLTRSSRSRFWTRFDEICATASRSCRPFDLSRP